MKLDGYIRVSRVAGREGDSFISPDLQREQILAYAKARGHTIDGWFTDLDKSGGTLDRPEFKKALERCRSGESGGIIAAKLDRISRSLSGLSTLIDEAKRDGWTLVAVDFGLDVKSASGKLVADILGSIAEWERTRRTEDWNDARARAVGRGVHVSSRTPTGYVRDEGGRLAVDPGAAPVIRELFRRRAHGEGWTALARFLDSSGVVSPYGSATWTHGAANKIIRNRVYLGEARSGEHVNPDGHEPIVTRTEWEAAQNARPGVSTRNGDGALLAGLVRCAGCRYLMKADKMRARDGSRIAFYRCRGRHASGICQQQSTILAHLIDEHVEDVYREGVGEVAARAVMGSADLTVVVSRLEDAERELAAYRDETLVGIIGAEAFRAGLEVRVARVEEIRGELSTMQANRPVPLLNDQEWSALTVAERRRQIAGAVDAIIVRPSRGAGKFVPPSERVLVLWRGEAPDDLPRRGRRVPLAPWIDETPRKLRIA